MNGLENVIDDHKQVVAQPNVSCQEKKPSHWSRPKVAFS
jgi:hypothetical protein